MIHTPVSAPAAPALSSVPPRQKLRSFVWLGLGLLFLLTFLAGARGLNEPDEGRYASMALDLTRHPAHWLEPRLSGFAHYDKPPLIYWTTAAALKVFGANPWAARAPSLLGALLALIGLVWAAARLYSLRVAWWSALVCGTLGQFWLLARFLSPDMLLTGWCALAIAAWAEARHRDGDWRFWALCLIFWTLAWWTKATAALAPLAGLAVAQWLDPNPAARKALRLPWLLFGILLLGLPWYWTMVFKYPELWNFFLKRELLGRIAGHADGRRGPVYYYLLLSLVAWLPWLPVALWIAARKLAAGSRAELMSLLRSSPEFWIAAVGLLIFSLISSKLPTYTLPLAPWASLFMARGLAKSPPSPFWTKMSRAIAVGFAAALLGIAIIAPKAQSSLYLNSSLAAVARQLESESARAVFLDRYWPGIEWAYSNPICYVVANNPRERSDDLSSSPQVQFCPPALWPALLKAQTARPIWLIHYRPLRSSPFLAYDAPGKHAQRIQMGDFLLLRIR